MNEELMCCQADTNIHIFMQKWFELVSTTQQKNKNKINK